MRVWQWELTLPGPARRGAALNGLTSLVSGHPRQSATPRDGSS